MNRRTHRFATPPSVATHRTWMIAAGSMATLLTAVLVAQAGPFLRGGVAHAHTLGVTVTEGVADDPETTGDMQQAGTPAPDVAAEHEPTEPTSLGAEQPEQPAASPSNDEAPSSPEPDASTPDGAGSEADAAPLDEGPTGPDTTRALATGVPMSQGVSANPMDVLLQTVASCQEDGASVRVLSADATTGAVVYFDAL